MKFLVISAIPGSHHFGYALKQAFLKGIKLVLSEKNHLVGDGKTIEYTKVVWENEYYILGEIIPIKVASDLQKY